MKRKALACSALVLICSALTLVGSCSDSWRQIGQRGIVDYIGHKCLWGFEEDYAKAIASRKNTVYRIESPFRTTNYSEARTN